MTRILVVDDEIRIREMIRKYAEYEGFQVTEAGDGMEAVELCETQAFDLIVMDIMMPNLDGFSACRQIKKTAPDMPIIMLSALGEEYDKVHGFDLGVDDYVVKPFSGKELMMRIHAILKRTRSGAGETFRTGGLEIDYSARTVSIDGVRVGLSPKEYELLVYLVKNAGIALTREQILQTVWGYDFFGDDRTLDTHIKLLRKNLGEYSRMIVTLRGVGYRFEKESQS
ncbi:MAG: response regulator transcription factor [Solobacterium sp.]|nr:response regulator transcription factor [Solobacterium sp.]MBR2829170.1 response regulator transcription factor [Solobacterium sp.]MBR3127896.1 response regulator transcription factor [Solobacterium sp.]